MATFTKVSYANASPRGGGDNRLGSIPAKAKHVNDLIDALDVGMKHTAVVNIAVATNAISFTSITIYKYKKIYIYDLFPYKIFRIFAS